MKDRFTVTLRGETSDGLKDAITLESGIIGRGFPQQKSLSGFLGSVSADNFALESSLNIDLSSTFEIGSL